MCHKVHKLIKLPKTDNVMSRKNVYTCIYISMESLVDIMACKEISVQIVPRRKRKLEKTYP